MNKQILLCLALAGFAYELQAQTNVALSINGGVATLSSTGFGGTADRINDGNRDGAYGNGSVAHSGAEQANEFVGIAFNGDYTIDSVNIFNRTDCCSERIDPFRLSLFDNGAEVFGLDFPEGSFVPTITGPNLSGMEIDVPITLADEVRVTILSNSYINLAEIEAINIPEPASVAFLGLAAGSVLIRRRRVA